MKKAVIVLDENGVPVSVGFDGGIPVPINAFLFLSNVPTEPPAGHILAFGNSDIVGKMIFNFSGVCLPRHHQGGGFGPWPRAPSRQGGGQVSLIAAFHHHGFPAGGADEFIFRDESFGRVDHPLRRSHRIARATLGAGVIVAHFLLTSPSCGGYVRGVCLHILRKAILGYPCRLFPPPISV